MQPWRADGQEPREIAWGEFRWEGARRKRGHRGRVGHREIAWGEHGRAPLGGSETEAWTPCYTEGARQKRGHRGRMGKIAWEGAGRKC